MSSTTRLHPNDAVFVTGTQEQHLADDGPAKLGQKLAAAFEAQA